MDVKLTENERIDDLGRRGYRIIQNRTKFCFGVDAALLAWFSEVHPGEQVMDFCTGTGIVPLLMEARNACGTYTGLEIQPDMAEMAGRSVELNGVSDHMKMVCGDLCDADSLFPKGSFDVITVNPPYMPAGSGLKNPDRAKALARHEIECTLDDVIREAALLLKSGGRFYMIHRPARLPEILRLMEQYRIAPRKMQLVHPYADKDATMVLISGTRGGRDRLSVGEPIVIYENENNYTEQLRRIYDDDYRNGAR